MAEIPQDELQQSLEALQGKKRRMLKLAQVLATRFLPEVSVPKDQSAPSEAFLMIGLNNGEIRRYDISNLFKRSEVRLIDHVNKKVNYNAYRQSKED